MSLMFLLGRVWPVRMRFGGRITEQTSCRWCMQYGHYGYRRIAALLGDAGWQVSDGRAEWLWRSLGLKVPAKQPEKGRLWLNDGSCVRLRPGYRHHVWSYDFVPRWTDRGRTDDRRAFRALNILDEFSRECLTIRVQRKLNSTGVIDALTDVYPARAARLHSVALSLIAAQSSAWQGTMGPSSLPRRFELGSKRSAPRPPSSISTRCNRTLYDQSDRL